MKKAYIDQVQLLVRLLAHVTKENSLGLKGGTAINLFLRDVPRLSVDLDLVYLPLQDRVTSLRSISDSLDRISSDVQRNVPNVTVRPVRLPGSDATVRLIVASPNGTVKVEVSPILRGTVFGSETRPIATAAAEEFGFVEANLVAVPDILAGKLCAALDRQHPRDLFDVEYILDSGIMDERLRKAFLVYLISHNRPMAELLAPRERDLDRAFVEDFDGMTRDTVTVEQLTGIRHRLSSAILPWLTNADREFLIGFKRGEPMWGQLGIEHVRDLPAVRWKQHNLDRMSPQARRAAIRRLEVVLAS